MLQGKNFAHPLPCPLPLPPIPRNEKNFRVPVLRPRNTSPSVCRPLCLILWNTRFHLLMYYFTRQGRRGEQTVVERKGFGLPTFDSRPSSN